MSSSIRIYLCALGAIVTSFMPCAKAATGNCSWIQKNPVQYSYAWKKEADHRHGVVEISSLKSGSGQGANLMQKLQINKWVIGKAKISAWIRSEQASEGARLWMRIDGEKAGGYGPLAFDNMDNRPILGTNDWQQYSLVTAIPDQAEFLSIGVTLYGKGRVWVDDVSIRPANSKESDTAAALDRFYRENWNQRDYEEYKGTLFSSRPRIEFPTFLVNSSFEDGLVPCERWYDD